ncbi:MAG: Crp/Fnr family transcriptional regulator [Bacteroidaceae bacterium]|nr:Crp/Fnr family transcriptional regulator [Bacteroidaceae bacterium]
MEQKFSNNGIDIQTLREFCEREGEAVIYRRGDQLEREGDPARWLAYVTEGCFKYVKYGVSDDKAHITWFSFEGEFVVDYPTFLYGRPAQTTIEAMMLSRVIRVTGQQLEQYFDQSKETMKLRAVIAEHILSQFRSRYLDLHCTTARERYDLLMQRCPGIVEHLDLQDIASFLNVHPNTISKIRRDITFEGR